MSDTSIFQIGKYNISIIEEKGFDFNSDYSDRYDAVFVIEKPDCDEGWYHKVISMTVEDADTTRDVLIIASYHTIVNKCAAPAGNRLFMLLNDTMIMLDPSNLKITKQEKLGIMMGTMEAVYTYKDDFIIYYEMDIMRIDRELNIKWDFAGRDIFHRPDNDEDTFKMKEDRICVYDFEGNYYEIDYDGKLLYEKISEEG